MLGAHGAADAVPGVSENGQRKTRYWKLSGAVPWSEAAVPASDTGWVRGRTPTLIKLRHVFYLSLF